MNHKLIASNKRRHLKLNRRKIVGTGFIVLALLLLASSLLYGASYYLTMAAQREAAVRAKLASTTNAPSKTVTITQEAVQGTPIKIDIPSVGISQPVDPGYYNADTGEWTLSYHAVYWASMTAPINSQTGNTFIYGHDVATIFGNLLKAQMGAKAIVTTSNGYRFTYTLQKSVAVNPTDTSEIQQTDQPTLTLQTCSGSWYQYRQMFTFSLDGYTKP